jgi:acetyl-CoA carboxylase carboxyl transferase subunit alpha
MAETLEFEEPIAILLKEIEALSMLPQTEVRDGEIEGLRKRIDQIRGEIFKRLTPWQCVLVARHPERPYVLDYVERIFTEFVELHGDRRFGDDGAIVCGFARYHGTPVLVCGHQKGRDMKQKVQRNFGYARPEGYRKALRAMQLADKFGRPILVFVDTPAAYPGVESEERGIAEAIALNLREMAILSVPIIVVITGEGGSGGALGLAVGDRVLMQEFAVYSVIPPEGCAAILWRDASRKIEAAEALKITAPDLIARNVVDGVVPEPLGGAHQDPDGAARGVDRAIGAALAEVAALSVDARLEARYARFRRLGAVGDGIVDTEAGSSGRTGSGRPDPARLDAARPEPMRPEPIRQER